jgi:hypothetical protein
MDDSILNVVTQLENVDHSFNHIDYTRGSAYSQAINVVTGPLLNNNRCQSDGAVFIDGCIT